MNRVSKGARASSAARFQCVWLVAIFMLGLGLRLFRLAHQPMWVDEMCRILWAKGYELAPIFQLRPSEIGIRLPIRPFAQAIDVINAHNPPLNGILLHWWMRLTGFANDFTVRLPFAAFGSLSIIAVFFAVRVKLSIRAALVASLLVASSPFHVYYSQEVNHYSTAFFFMACSFYFYFRMLVSNRFGIRIGYAIFGTLALFTHYYCAFVLLFQFLSLLIYKELKLRALLRDVVAYIGIAVTFGWYLPIVHKQMAEMNTFGGHLPDARYLFQRFAEFVVTSLLGIRIDRLEQGTLLSLLLCICATCILGIVATKPRSLRAIMSLNILGPLFVLIICCYVFKQDSMLWSRYLFFFTFALFIPIAVFLSEFRFYKIPVILLFKIIITWGNHYQYFVNIKEDWHRAARTISNQASPSDSIIIHNPTLGFSLARYLETENLIFGLRENPELDKQLKLATDANPAVWFVSIWIESQDFVDKMHTRLSAKYAERTDFPIMINMKVTRYARPRLTD